MDGLMSLGFPGFSTGPVGILSLSLGLSFLITIADATPITACPKYQGHFYIADHQNKCTYYWCLNGRLIGSYRCPLGTGVPDFHRSNRSPCQIKVRACSRYGFNAGIDPSTPPPTTRITTPEQNPQAETTESEDETTTQIDDVTTQMPDDTFEEMTEDPGSGDGDDFMPVGGSTDGPIIDLSGVTGSSSGALFEVLNGKSIKQGLRIGGVTDLGACLQACSQLSALCTGIDFNKASTSCYVHTVSTECNELVDDPDSDHIRFMQC